jgi:DNA-directed RNA polymerase subunit beta'
MLSTKHKATVGERKGNAYEQAANLMNNPAENFKDEATIASVNGKVNAVQKTLLGDHNVFIDGKSHFVPISQQVLVEPGQQIRVGDRLSSGTINPRKLVNLRGIGAGREYMAKELRDIYGGGLDPRHFEMIAKNLIKYVEVEDPGHTSLLTGEKLDINHILPFLDHGVISVPTSKSKGKVLAKGILNLTAGTYLDDNHVEDLIKAGVGSVEVTGSGLKVTPIVPGLQTAKMLDPDWISRLSFSRLRDTLKESASVGATSNIHSTDPIPSYVIGREFGEGPNGAY